MQPPNFSNLARLCSLIYERADGWDNYWNMDGVVIARADNTLVLRGSCTAEDWVRDLDAIPVWHDRLGFVHHGFALGMDEVFTEVRDLVKPGFIITGHSLGGARARILAGLFIVNGTTDFDVVTFGAPKPAFINLQRVLNKSGCRHISFRNRNDVVPMLPPIGDWVHTEAWQAVDAAPAIDDFEPLRDHSMDLYIEAVST